MSKPKALLAAAVAVGAASVVTLAVPTPASAGSIGAGCTTRGENWALSATAFFTDLGNGQRQWPEFRYQLFGGGNKSNVDIRLFDGNVRVLFLRSPDNRRPGIEYKVNPVPPPVLTTVANPESVTFEATFDKPVLNDPKCLAAPDPI